MLLQGHVVAYATVDGLCANSGARAGDGYGVGDGRGERGGGWRLVSEHGSLLLKLPCTWRFVFEQASCSSSPAFADPCLFLLPLCLAQHFWSSSEPRRGSCLLACSALPSRRSPLALSLSLACIFGARPSWGFDVCMSHPSLFCPVRTEPKFGLCVCVFTYICLHTSLYP